MIIGKSAHAHLDHYIYWLFVNVNQHILILIPVFHLQKDEEANWSSPGNICFSLGYIHRSISMNTVSAVVHSTLILIPHSYSGRFPQVGAKFLALKKIFLPRSLLKPRPGTNPPCKTAPIVSKPVPYSPNCADFTHFRRKNTKWIQKNPSGIVSIPDGFHGGSRRIRTIDLPGMNRTL